MFHSIIPKIFQTNTKTIKVNKHGQKVNNDYVQKFKHFPPLIKEWKNGIYAYNKNTVKYVPSLEKNMFNLLKSHFSLNSLVLNKRTISKQLHMRSKRLTTNKLIASVPDLKHTSDSVNIVVYVYNRHKLFWANKLKEINSLDLLYEKKEFEDSMSVIKGNNLKLKLKINGRIGAILKKVSNEHFTAGTEGTSIHLGKTYIDNFISKCMRKEIAAFRYKQSISFEESKYEKQHLLPLIDLFERIYTKKVVINIVNLKYFFNSSSVFSEALITKLKNKNTPIDVLSESLDIFTIPPINRINVYNDMYNRKSLTQYTFYRKVKNIKSCNTVTSSNYKDMLEESLFNLSHFNMSTSKEISSTPNLYEIVESLKNKFTCGIRIEVAGRLTKRNKAARSIHKLRYKGNIKNIDSSIKNLSTVLLRGHAKSGLLYSQYKSKLRIGAFGLKSWINSN